MNKINRKVEYALIALKHMRSKQPGEMTTVKEISNLYKCPFEATSKVLQTLAQRGLVRSEQGAHGGYQLAKDLQRTSLYELMEMIVGPVEIARCLHERDTKFSGCDLRESCNVVSPIHSLNKRLSEFYQALSVAELLDGRGPRERQPEIREAAAKASHSGYTLQSADQGK